MSYFDATIPAESEGVKLGASRIRAMAAALNTIIAKVFDDTGVFLDKWVLGAMIANDTTTDANRAITSDHLKNGAATTRVLADGVLSADATGQAKMADGFFTADTAGRAKLADGLITLAKLAWSQFFTGGGSSLPKTTPIGADLILIADSENSDAVAQITLLQAQQAGTFVGVEHTVSTSGVITEAHGLGAAPARVRWVLVCKTANLGYSVGDEVDVSTAKNSSTLGIEFTVGANSALVFLVPAASGNIQLFNFATQSGATAITTADWKFKCYANL